MENESSILAFANRTTDNLFNNYIRLGLKASGEYGESLDSKVEFNKKGVSIEIFGAKQAKWMEEGRQPNRDQSTEAVKKLYPVILQWAIDKSISVTNLKSFAYLSAMKIVREGWKVPNQHNAGGVISDVINENWLREGVDVAGGALLTEITSDILTRFKKFE